MASVPRSYVLRVYRRAQANRRITGILELPERGTREAFRSFDELKQLLAGAAPKRRKQSGGRR